MTHKKYVLFVLIVLIATAGCKKGGNSTVTHPNDTTTSPYPIVNTMANAYLVGTSTAAYPNNIPLATIWQNGVASVLSGSNSEANAIALNGSYVYIAGQTATGMYNVATLWKNGVATELATNQAMSKALAIAISNNDVYIGGLATAADGSMQAAYWKNGALTIVGNGPTSTPTGSQVNGIAVSGDDIYMAGYTYDRYNGYEATYWKDGTATLISANAGGSVATGIALMGTTVYIVGFINNVAAIWKDGVATTPGAAVAGSIANAIAINGSDFYVAGINNGNAVYWKNSVPNVLTLGSGEQGVLANAIALNGSDVFVAGGFNGDADNALYWWNGSPIKIGQGTDINIVYGMAVVPK